MLGIPSNGIRIDHNGRDCTEGLWTYDGIISIYCHKYIIVI